MALGGKQTKLGGELPAQPSNAVQTWPPAWLPEPDLQEIEFEYEHIDVPEFSKAGVPLYMSHAPTGRATARLAFFGHPPATLRTRNEEVASAARLMVHIYAGAQDAR